MSLPALVPPNQPTLDGALGISDIPTASGATLSLPEGGNDAHLLHGPSTENTHPPQISLSVQDGSDCGASGLGRAASIRSQRLWHDIDGKPLLPLPSPGIFPSTPHIEWEHTDAHHDNSTDAPSESSRTSAFFDTQPIISSPKPPSSKAMVRSASTRKPSSGAEHVQIRRQRAVSSPHRGTQFAFSSWDADAPPKNNLLSPTPLAVDTFLTPTADSNPQLPTDSAFVSSPTEHARRLEDIIPKAEYAALSTEAVTARRAGMTRHVHGPSMNLTKESLLPSPMAPDAPRKAIQKRGSLDVSDQLLRSLDTPSENEDDDNNRIGPYRVTAKLGTGAFSKVVLAERVEGAPDIICGKRHSKVALKMIACEPWKSNERMRVSWVREVEVLKHVSHPSIVDFITSFRTPVHYTLVLEALDGGELFDILAQHHGLIAKQEWFVRRVFGELANVVGWMHEHNLVHRDLKLENIMLTRPLFRANAPQLRPSDLGPVPIVKITDFGLARFIEGDTKLETRCGSEEYVAPELIIGRSYDGRKTDAWALGIVLYALLTGVLPFIEPPHKDSALPHQIAQRESQVDSSGSSDHDVRLRKAHLLRIAKGELSWPSDCNDASTDVPSGAAEHRLVTPRARHVVLRLLERDAGHRAHCWDLWKDPWLTEGSFGDGGAPMKAESELGGSVMLCVAHEASALGERVPIPLDPRSAEGSKWLSDNAFTCDREPGTVARHDMQDVL